MKNLTLLSILLVGVLGFMTSCSSSDACHECHVAYMLGDTEIEVPITNSEGGDEFCGAELEDVETEGYTHTIDQTIIDNDTISSFGASSIPLIPFEDLPLKTRSFLDSNLIHLPNFVLNIAS